MAPRQRRWLPTVALALVAAAQISSCDLTPHVFLSDWTIDVLDGSPRIYSNIDYRDGVLTWAKSQARNDPPIVIAEYALATSSLRNVEATPPSGRNGASRWVANVLDGDEIFWIMMHTHSAIALFDRDTGQVIGQPDIVYDAHSAFSLDRDRKLAAIGEGFWFRVYDIENWDTLYQQCYGGWVRDRFQERAFVKGIVFTGQSQIATVDSIGRVTLWRDHGREAISTFRLPWVSERRRGAVSFSTDGSVIAFPLGNTIEVWHVENSRRLVSVSSKSPVTGLGFSQCDRYLLAGVAGRVYLWDWRKGVQVGRINLSELSNVSEERSKPTFRWSDAAAVTEIGMVDRFVYFKHEDQILVARLSEGVTGRPQSK